MKGIVFSEFIEFVEQQFSAEIADRMIDDSELPSGGAYTAVGTYNHQEMLTLVTTLGQLTGQPIPALVKAFGKHLFGRLAASYPVFLTGVEHSFDLLKSIEDHIHKEVRKLYPDAELPRFEWEQPDTDTLVLRYHSHRPLADLAEGLMEGCVEHFGEQIEIKRKDMPDQGETVVHFTLSKVT